MITGAHSIIYSTNAEADRAFLRDVLRFPNIDVGDGWLMRRFRTRSRRRSQRRSHPILASVAAPVESISEATAWAPGASRTA